MSPTLSVDVYDDDGDPMIVSFYDSSDDSLIGTTSIATTSPPATSTATTSWNNLSASTTYNWYAVSDDGEATTSSSVWSFTTLPPPNSPTNLSQYKKDCSTAITTGEVLATTSICFEAQIEPNSGYDVKLQLDYSASSLDGIPEATSSTWKSTTSTISILNSLPEGGTYKWQVRTIDSSGATSSWTQFNSGDTAFVVKVYFAAGTSTSVNLLEGLSVNNIQSFYYDASLLPGEGALKFRFATSSTSGPWYDKDGNLNQWTEANTTGRGNIHLADLGWSGPNFYYQARFEATTEGLYGPELDLIGVEYNVESVDIKGDTVLRNIEIGFFSGSKEEDSESFESGFGDWYDDTSDDAWTRNSGSTGSSGTGPSSAYDGSYYIYVETSSGDGANSSGDKTTIEYDLGSTKDGYVDFYVHQYGTDMGTLYLQGWDGSSWNTIWSTTDNTDSWRHIQQANTEFSGYSKLRFQNVAAGGYEGDVALDLIKVFSN